MRKIHMQRFANISLSIMAMMATVFANMACRGRCYEPVVPGKLQQKE